LRVRPGRRPAGDPTAWPIKLQVATDYVARGLSAAEVARLRGIHPATVHRYVTEVLRSADPDAATLRSLVRAAS
jgi:predicted transcriptional regulator